MACWPWVPWTTFHSALHGGNPAQAGVGRAGEATDGIEQDVVHPTVLQDGGGDVRAHDRVTRSH